MRRRRDRERKSKPVGDVAGLGLPIGGETPPGSFM